MTEIDDIEQAASLAEAETGARSTIAKVPLCLAAPVKERHRRWTPEEDAYLRENYRRMTEAQMAADLGRTAAGVEIHIKRELHLVAPSKAPEILTAEQVAVGLGADGKSIHRLMDLGLMPHHRLPDKDVTRAIDREALVRWMLEPLHWIFFKPERVGMLHPRGKRPFSATCYDFAFWEQTRAVVLAARSSWPDAWMTPGQAAAALGMKRSDSHKLVNRAIRRGTIKAMRWGNWWIRKSDLPAEGMSINAEGRIVPASEIGRKHCPFCHEPGHNRRTCPVRERGEAI